MTLRTLVLQNFRNYKSSTFAFEKTNIIVGRNTIGKSNILEAIGFLSHGKSFKAEKDVDAIMLGENFAKITGTLEEEEGKALLELVLSKKKSFSKKFLINHVARRQNDFVSRLLTVLFTPEDIEIITDSPSLRRKFIDRILIQASKRYRNSLSAYDKALRQRNKLLYNVREGKKIFKQEEFEYWNNLLIENGTDITFEREKLVDYLNDSQKSVFNFSIFYDKSTITAERIQKYQNIELQAGITLIGPQRDEFLFFYGNTKNLLKEFGSRGEQRLTVLQLKILEIDYLKKITGYDPILLLDDIFSELDSQNIERITGLIDMCQSIVTTTHEEFIPKKIASKIKIIPLD